MIFPFHVFFEPISRTILKCARSNVYDVFNRKKIAKLSEPGQCTNQIFGAIFSGIPERFCAVDVVFLKCHFENPFRTLACGDPKNIIFTGKRAFNIKCIRL